MKATSLRNTAALALALALSACGGKASFDINGTLTNSAGVVTALPNSGLVLANGNDTVTVPAGATSFTFPNRISYGTEYAVTVRNPPNHMNCSVANGTGSAGHLLSISATVSCTQNRYQIGGTASGLDDLAVGVAAVAATATTPEIIAVPADVLVLVNGSTTVALTKGQTSYTFADPVAVGQSYGVTVLTQPNARVFCTVANGNGIMGDALVANINVTCVPTAPAVIQK
ncbi:MAG: hypothetical protein V4724_15330 [Pseudomonadota bacterium]